MEMWLKRSTLLFLTAAATVISGQHLVTLDDKMKRVEVPFGSLLDLKCDLDVTGYERFWVKWYFNPAGPSFNESHNVSQKIFNRSNLSIVDSDGKKGEILWNCTTKATEENSGWYFCKVTAEIPVHTNIQSNRTEVVIRPVSTGNTSGWWLWIVVGVSAFILIVLLVICVLLRRRWCRSRAEDPVYANTRPVVSKQPSPRPGTPTDNLKKVSSSQNLRNQSPGRRYEEGKRRCK